MRAAKLLFCLLAALLAVGLTSFALAEDTYPAEIKDSIPESDYSGKTVILHSNDVHGAIDGYAKMAALKRAYEELGAEVFMVDAGDFSQGDPYVNVSKGMDAISMMNAAGYALATLGNHDFDYGVEQLMANLDHRTFPVICANILRDGEPLFAPRCILRTQAGTAIGFFGLDTPESQTKTDPKLVAGLRFLAEDDMTACAQAQIDALRDEGADLVIGLVHLGVNQETQERGNSSIDLYAKTSGLDFLIDGHSHTVMTAGMDGEPIQSTGTKFAYIGVIELNADGTIGAHYLLSADGLASASAVEDTAQAIEKKVDDAYSAVIAASEVVFDGDRSHNRSQETNNGDLITDAFLWFAQTHPDLLEVSLDHVVALESGGSIRDSIPEGAVTKKMIYTVHPFGNTVNILYVTGAELLEVLEASTFCTPDLIGGYPQSAGIRFTVDTTKAYDGGALYPNSTYQKPNSIRRVTIDSIGGAPFDPEETYGVVTNNFLAAGGDAACLFATKNSIETGVSLDELLIEYITDELGGVLTREKYGQPRGDQTILLAGAVSEAPAEADTGAASDASGKAETGTDGSAQPEEAPMQTYTVKAGDCLWTIAERFYGSGTKWGLLFTANRDQITNPARIYVGQVLRIPDAA